MIRTEKTVAFSVPAAEGGFDVYSTDTMIVHIGTCCGVPDPGSVVTGHWFLLTELQRSVFDLHTIQVELIRWNRIADSLTEQRQVESLKTFSDGSTSNPPIDVPNPRRQ